MPPKSGNITVSMAVGYFHMPNKDPITIHCCDGHAFPAAKKPDPPYYLILVDAFDEKGMSGNISTKDFFRLCPE